MTSEKMLSIAIFTIAISSALAADCTVSCPGQGCNCGCQWNALVKNPFQEFTKDLPSSKYLVNAGEKIYYVETNVALNWHDAVAFCKNYKMELASIKNLNENTILRDHLQKNNLLNVRYWIGGNDLAKSQQFVWQSNGEIFEFTDWSPNNPNNQNYNGTTEHCVQVYSDASLQWDDYFCEAAQNFICEF